MYRQFIIKLELLILTVGCIFFTGCNSGKSSFYEASDRGDREQIASDTSAIVTETSVEMETGELLPVYVCGAVCAPGVYYLDSDSIKSDALVVAGGFAEGAAKDYVNLAERVISGEKIYFPYEEELESGYNITTTDDNQTNGDGLVNINTATKEELMSLPGIGESKAEAIITYREDYGPFHSIEDITNISGIKEGVYNNIKEYIVVN